MSWMDLKMQSAMKAQKLNEDSKRVQVGKTQKGTGQKPTQVTDDLKSRHAQDVQKLTSYSKSEQLGSQKGTGEKAHGLGEDLASEHARQAQKLTSYSKSEQLGSQKGTGEAPSSNVDQHTEQALRSQKVASYGHSENLGQHKGDTNVAASPAMGRSGSSMAPRSQEDAE